MKKEPLSHDTTAAMSAWTEALGEDAVATDIASLSHYEMNTSEYSSSGREIVAVLRPSSVDAVQRIVEVARVAQLPVHPISSGRNWGLGSALPVCGPAALIDLSRMNSIVEINERFRYAVIEPGVLQGQLSQRLLELGGNVHLNVTGAGPATSITGNFLDRGCGNLGPRDEDLIGMEIVLGNGLVVRTGKWHLTERVPHHYAPGLGPDLRGMFVQSNFGIVTKLVIRLHKVTPLLEVSFECQDGSLSSLVDALRTAHEDAVVNGSIRISDTRSDVIKFFPEGSGTWHGSLTVRGSSGMRSAAREELLHRLGPHTVGLNWYDSDDDTLMAQPVGEEPFRDIRFRLANGMPSDGAWHHIADQLDESIPVDLDHDRSLPGFLCVNVSVPFAGEYVEACNEIIRETENESGVNVSRMYAKLGPDAIQAFFPYSIDRSSAVSVQRGHSVKSDLIRRFDQHGIYPIRMDIDSMLPFLTGHRNEFWDCVSAIKRAVDPDGIVSPGRFCPL